MSGISPIGTENPSSYTTMSGTAYPLAIDGDWLVALRTVGRFAPRALPTPSMALMVDPGSLFDGVTLTEVGGWFTGASVGASSVINFTGQIGFPQLYALAGVSTGMMALAYAYVNGVQTFAFSAGGSAQHAIISFLSHATLSLQDANFAANATGACEAAVSQTSTVIVGQPIGLLNVGASVSNGSNIVSSICNGGAGSFYSTTGIFAGMAFTDAGGYFPAGTTVTSVDSNSQIHVSNNASGIPGGGTVVENVSCSVPVPVSHPRFDRIVLNNTTGIATWVEGTEAIMPTTPAIPYGYSPCCQLYLTTSTTAITGTSNIIDERDLSRLGTPAINQLRKVTITPVTGFSYTPANGISRVLMTPAGTLATGTITTPANPLDGDQLSLGSTQTITSFTLAANAGQTVFNGPSTLNAGQRLGWVYDLASTSWIAAN